MVDEKIDKGQTYGNDFVQADTSLKLFLNGCKNIG